MLSYPACGALAATFLLALSVTGQVLTPDFSRVGPGVARIHKPEHRFQFLLSRARDRNSEEGLAAAILLTREKGASARLRKAADRGSSRTRAAVLGALARMGHADLHFALCRALDDRVGTVRRHVLATIAVTKRLGRAKKLLREDLTAKDAATRIRATKGVALLQDEIAIPILRKRTTDYVRRLAGNGRRARSPRGHFAVVQRTGYVRDFDAEVA